MKQFSAATAKAMPWKNAGGATRELYKHGAGGRVQWRISLADITQNGAFSTFPNTSRVLTIAKGHGITLTGSGVKLRARPAIPLAFQGALALVSKLIDGPTQALNIMWDSAQIQVDVQVLQAGAFEIAQNDHTALYVLKGAARLNHQDLHTGEGGLLVNTLLKGVVPAGAQLWIAQINSV